MRNSLPTLLFIFVASAILPAQSDTVRNPVAQPFFATSIWNMPIGSEAVYKPANLRASEYVGADIVHVLRLDADNPSQRVVGHGTFGPGRCDSVVAINMTLNVPDGWLVPDAGNSPYGGTPNSSFALIDNAGERVFQGQVLARCEVGGPVYLPDWMQFPNNRPFTPLISDGLSSGAGHGASQMSVIGGLIRLGEFSSPSPISHAIKINPFAAEDLHYSEEVPGFRWPATRADGYAPDGYNRNADPELVMGSLLAIPPDITAASLGLSSPAVLKFFYTLQNFGVYFVEDAAFDTWDIVMERDAELEFAAVYGYSLDSDTFRTELNTLMGALHVITNNGPNSIGGGGHPLVPLAPELGLPDAGESFVSSITGRVEAENYQVGGPGIAYSDADASNNGFAFRPNEGVDLEPCADVGGGVNLGWTVAGEWLQYTVVVAEAGEYLVTLRHAGGDETIVNPTIEVIFEANGVSSGNVALDYTGGWQNWQNTSISLPLAAGLQTMRINIVGGGFNLNYVDFEKTTSTTVAQNAPSKVSLFPNPTPGELKVSLDHSPRNTAYKIIDAYGRSVREGALRQRELVLPLSLLPAGTYHFLLYEGKKLTSRSRFILGE